MIPPVWVLCQCDIWTIRNYSSAIVMRTSHGFLVHAPLLHIFRSCLFDWVRYHTCSLSCSFKSSPLCRTFLLSGTPERHARSVSVRSTRSASRVPNLTVPSGPRDSLPGKFFIDLPGCANSIFWSMHRVHICCHPIHKHGGGRRLP